MFDFRIYTAVHASEEQNALPNYYSFRLLMEFLEEQYPNEEFTALIDLGSNTIDLEKVLLQFNESLKSYNEKT